MRLKSLLKSSGLAALAAMLAVTTVPADAFAESQNRGGWGQSQGGGGSRGGGGWSRGGGGGSVGQSRGGWSGRSAPVRSESRAGGQMRSESRGGGSWRSQARAPAPRVDRSASGGWNSRGQFKTPVPADRPVASPSWRGGTAGDGARYSRRSGDVDRNRATTQRRGDGGQYAWRSGSNVNRQWRDGDRNTDRNTWRDRDRNNWRDRDRDNNWRDRDRNDRNHWGRDRDRHRSGNNHYYRNGHRYSYNPWNNRWRDDRRYDWYGHRRGYSSLYRLGPYYSPYGYHRYSRIGIGFHLDSLFFGSSYWLDDPWDYRLPAAYGPYRWVRYYDDVLLVNVYTGEVVDAVYDFFW